ncbi:beta-N-acetylhexosaminidase [Acetobacter sp.]|uniref:beta-N-acetylhexosaminidase n=1 Tax=Acetobacter sp. TaxID=440 RepID=UPI0025C5C630|nr:family 20 glycosylhydrolase [Acetobacter sp.]MCH4091087.1 beta-N-acetylhexosaminidase [Acetobacter sp.]MCI1300270.1 beta-N-acetylhexosaminidase [Acetobacter sp.]MCI1316062.1 beta-N-acetylhexosaminidase [Acetobacter sp.]
MPVPSVVSWQEGEAKPCDQIDIHWHGAHGDIPEAASQRFLRHLKSISSISRKQSACSLEIRSGDDQHYLSRDEREAYQLTIQHGKILLTADGPAGVLHGFATLLQLVRTTSQGLVFPDVSIRDMPRFPWRGLMIDVARHFMSVAALRRQIDAMELTKLNVLHLHLSDGAAFRVESLVFPRLQTVSSHGQYYPQDNVRDLVAYAAERGIRVVPEFDVPGHALAVLEAYPELAAQPLPAANAVCTGSSACIAGSNANNPALDPTTPETLDFIEKLFVEMMRLFPDAYFHAGGDEVVASQWTGNPQIASYMKAHNYPDASTLQGEFTAKIQAFLAEQGKTMIGWDEVLSAPVPKSVVADIWRSSKWINAATVRQHPTLVSSGYYLDLLRPAREYYRVDPYDLMGSGLAGAELEHAREIHFRLADAFALDPALPPLNARQKEYVLGGEAVLWTEAVTEQMLNQRIWPRAAVIAERLWSPETVRDVSDMERRLPLIVAELNALALTTTQQDREQMLARYPVAGRQPLETVLQVTSPVRNYTINRMIKKAGEDLLTWPVAMAEPDSLPAMRFNQLAEIYVRGDHSVAPELRRDLEKWSANDGLFEKTIGGVAALEMIRPVSQQLSLLAQAGLEAIDGTLDTARKAQVEKLLAQQQEAFAASSWQLLSPPLPQPPGGLLIAIVPGVRTLVNASPVSP